MCSSMAAVHVSLSPVEPTLCRWLTVADFRFSCQFELLADIMPHTGSADPDSLLTQHCCYWQVVSRWHPLLT